MNKDQTHISALEAYFVGFHPLDLDGIDAISLGQFLISAGLIIQAAFIRIYVVETVIKIPVGRKGIFFQKIMQVPFRVVIRCREVLGEKDFDGQRLGQGGYHFFAGGRKGI